jgi:hypothetical protein
MKDHNIVVVLHNLGVSILNGRYVENLLVVSFALFVFNLTISRSGERTGMHQCDWNWCKKLSLHEVCYSN